MGLAFPSPLRQISEKRELMTAKRSAFVRKLVSRLTLRSAFVSMRFAKSEGSA